MAAMPILNSRYIRRRWLLILVFVCCAVYLLSHTLSKNSALVSEDYEVRHTILRQPFQWKPKVPDLDTNSSKTIECRNSIQGQTLIVDERGYVCRRHELDSGGCCDVLKRPEIIKHSCDTCRDNGCCTVYEYCVSCCLHPEKERLLRKILVSARESSDKLLVSVTDHFELCLAKCRTSSMSVQHENSYRNSKSKFCYGENPPELQALVT